MLVERDQLYHLKQSKKLIAFGAGEIAIKTLHLFEDCFDYYIDNAPIKQGSVFNNRPVYPPQQLEKENKQDVFIIICVEAYHEVQQQLEGMGFRINEHYGFSILLKSYFAFDKVNSGTTDLLVSCYGGGAGLYRINTQNSRVERLYDGAMRGICLCNDEIFIVNDTEGFWCLDRDTLEVKFKFIKNDISKPCGIAYHKKEQKIFLVETGRDRVLVIDRNELKVVDEFRISEKYLQTSHEQHHLNDIILVDDNTLWLSMFSMAGRWRNNIFDGSIIEFDLKFNFRNTIINNACKPHSLIKKENTLFYLDSYRGMLQAGTEKTLGVFPSFVRGLDKDQDRFYVGLSRHRHIEELKDVEIPVMVNSGIIVFCDKDKIYKFIPIEGAIDIYGIADLAQHKR